MKILEEKGSELINNLANRFIECFQQQNLILQQCFEEQNTLLTESLPKMIAKQMKMVQQSEAETQAEGAEIEVIDESALAEDDEPHTVYNIKFDSETVTICDEFFDFFESLSSDSM